MKWNYKIQLIATVALIVVFYLLTGFLKTWLFATIGRCLAGLLWVVNPVLPDDVEKTKGIVRVVRFCGVFLILYGLFGRLR